MTNEVTKIKLNTVGLTSNYNKYFIYAKGGPELEINVLKLIKRKLKQKNKHINFSITHINALQNQSSKIKRKNRKKEEKNNFFCCFVHSNNVGFLIGLFVFFFCCELKLWTSYMMLTANSH